MNLYSYSLQNKKRPTIDKSKVGLTKDKAGNLIAKSSTKNVPVLVKQNTKKFKKKIFSY